MLHAGIGPAELRILGDFCHWLAERNSPVPSPPPEKPTGMPPGVDAEAFATALRSREPSPAAEEPDHGGHPAEGGEVFAAPLGDMDGVDEASESTPELVQSEMQSPPAFVAPVDEPAPIPSEEPAREIAIPAARKSSPLLERMVLESVVKCSQTKPPALLEGMSETIAAAEAKPAPKPKRGEPDLTPIEFPPWKRIEERVIALPPDELLTASQLAIVLKTDHESVVRFIKNVNVKSTARDKYGNRCYSTDELKDVGAKRVFARMEKEYK